MKQLLLFIILISTTSFCFADCVLKNQLGEQRHFICHTENSPKIIHVLDLKGNDVETAYYHGLFLQEEIENGLIKGVLRRLTQGLEALDPKTKEHFLILKKCAIDGYRKSVSESFKLGLLNLYNGLKKAGTHLKWSEYEEANYLTEFSIYAESLQRLMQVDKTGANIRVLKQCGLYFVEEGFANAIDEMISTLRKIKMGCTGIAISSQGSSDGTSIHARNFDTGLLGFYEKNQVIILNTLADGTKVVSLSSAGLHYGGGVSGFNSHGISISLHELQTTETKLNYFREVSDIAPYLAHRILLQAKTLNEAIAILKDRRGFGAWTFLISDSKTDESISVELSGNSIVVARHEKHNFMPQTNHFIDPQMQENGYEYSLNKTLETHARFDYIHRTSTEDFGHIDIQWVIDHLAGHYDERMGMRSFGRTTTKVYTAATHIMIPARNEWWMSLGDQYPTNRSPFVGFRWTNGNIPVEMIGIKYAHEDSHLTQWYNSMGDYVQAFLNNEESSKDLKYLNQTVKFLESAIQKSMQNNIFEFPYHFMKARIDVEKIAIQQLQHKLNKKIVLNYDQKLSELQNQFSEIENKISLDPYEKFQLVLWTFRAENLKSKEQINNTELNNKKMLANRLVDNLILKYPRQTDLIELKKSINISNQLTDIAKSEISLCTVE